MDKKKLKNILFLIKNATVEVGPATLRKEVRLMMDEGSVTILKPGTKVLVTGKEDEYGVVIITYEGKRFSVGAKAFEDEPAAPATPAPAAAATAGPSTAKPGGAGPRTTPSAVKEMQEQMQIFVGKIFPEYDSFSSATATSATSTTSATPMKSRGHSEYGLGNFLASHYGGSYERFKDPRTAQQSEAAEDIIDVLSSMRSIGSSISTTKPDGLWGQRTQKAIKNIKNLSSAIVNFSQAIGFDDTSFSKDNVNIIDDNIPKSENPLKERRKLGNLSDNANTIKEQLIKLNAFTDKLQEHLTTKYGEQFATSPQEAYKEDGTPVVQKFRLIPTTANAPSVSLAQSETDLLKRFTKPISVTILNTNQTIDINFGTDNYGSIIDKLKVKLGAGTINSDWISRYYNDFIEKAKKDVIAVLNTNQLILSRNKSDLIRSIFTKLDHSSAQLATIIALSYPKEYEEYISGVIKRFKIKLTNCEKLSLEELKAIEASITLFNEQLDSLAKGKVK